MQAHRKASERWAEAICRALTTQELHRLEGELGKLASWLAHVEARDFLGTEGRSQARRLRDEGAEELGALKGTGG